MPIGEQTSNHYRVPSPPGRRPVPGSRPFAVTFSGNAPNNPYLLSEPYTNDNGAFAEANIPALRVPPNGIDGKAQGNKREISDANLTYENAPKSKRQASDPNFDFEIGTPTVLTSSFQSGVSLRPSSSGFLGNRSYQYAPLQNAEFRLVRLFPESKTMIRCEILHKPLYNAPIYTAISYAWGDAGATRNIRLENALVPISASLFGALSALRQKNKDILIWADALCIDQQNSSERGQQIQLMPEIYATAESVAIWLGDEADDSASAIGFLRVLAKDAEAPERVLDLISSPANRPGLVSVVPLFERDYWQRLWVVQEIFRSRSITVYCGREQDPWSVYLRSSEALSQRRTDLERIFPGGFEHGHFSSLNQLSYPQVLVYQGPNSLPDFHGSISTGPASLLQILRICRRKLASNPRDKFYGILGILAERERSEFLADYSLSVKDIYTEIVDYLLKTTGRLDVLCDAIHYPPHASSATLPSFVPDWSHSPAVTAMGSKFDFSAASTTRAECMFIDERLSRLLISAIYIDTIHLRGTAVSTLCTLGDYLMAFLHWRALLLACGPFTSEISDQVEHWFCSCLSLGQIPSQWDEPGWHAACYHVFAKLLRERLPRLSLDSVLQGFADTYNGPSGPEAARQFLQTHFGDRMMGRCFCYTSNGYLGMGSGFMKPGDVVVVPLGCSTPVLLRPTGPDGLYRFIGDVYIHHYMYGRAISKWKEGLREKRTYVLH